MPMQKYQESGVVGALALHVEFLNPSVSNELTKIDERQITHLICARRKYDLYDFFRFCFWACFLFFFLYKRPKNTP